jgi:hypothetical protein
MAQGKEELAATRPELIDRSQFEAVAKRLGVSPRKGPFRRKTYP